jgi:hypothetical protein
MAGIPYEAVYGSFLGLMFSSRTRFLMKQLVCLLARSSRCDVMQLVFPMNIVPMHALRCSRYT